MDNQKITGNERELLLGQMRLLAEKSKNCSASELVDMTGCMTDICAFLYGERREPGIAGFRHQEDGS